MLFNSQAFLLFFPSVVLIYFLLPFRFRWMWLLLASYYFYMNWEPIYGVLLLLSTSITFYSSVLIEKAKTLRSKKAWLYAGLLSNFGILGFFKYYNFITENVFYLLSAVGARVEFPEFKVLLPVGISFYVFQAVGYTIDVYRGTIRHERHFGKYALFVSYFPQLVAGPIERTANLLPQFKKKHVFIYERFLRGLRLMLYGFFMKLVVADRLAIYVDTVYNNADRHSSPTLILATIMFSIQIYCDFAGYSSIALGASRIMGFKLMTNFRRPYLASSIGQFWRRWHISLSTWFKDYLYFSLGGSRVDRQWKIYRNLMITFLISGLWHGANWTFVIWGGLNGLYLVMENIFSRFTAGWKSWYVKLTGIIYVYILICVSWIFFRANSLADAIEILQSIFSFKGNLFIPADPEVLMYCTFGMFMIFSFEGFYEFLYRKRYIKRYVTLNYLFMIFLLLCIALMGVFDGGQFIYFQF